MNNGDWSILRSVVASLNDVLVAQDDNDGFKKAITIQELAQFILYGMNKALPIRITPEGGVAVLLVNQTGHASVKGELVESSTTVDSACAICEADGNHCFGAIYEDGVAVGEQVWVVVAGIAEVLLKDTTASLAGNWVIPSDVAGRADATATTVPGGDLQAHENHFKEIGHCIEAKLAGTGVLAKIMMHFN